ncbi:hypothetical protein FRUB_06601 [Fimbriiglobus ruber]|uniref:Uncharacterized protein n=1 Tax=Fimbriiglobus ruber TaxID=1908690 RepID=A0A225D7D9_9BACT|nr:hypothetical protein FRUB_06601 [Fimbriiglobus ruber]
MAAAVLALGTTGTAPAQLPKVSPFNNVDPITLPLDRSEVWTLHFAYLSPRIITLDVPKYGKRQVWYMVYQVWNTSDTPQPFVPKFELVTKDGELRSFLDEPQPSVAQAISEHEDIQGPKGRIELQTSIGISKTRIPVTKPDSIPRAVYGVAIWLDVPAKVSTTNNFSVYVTGLSNGVAELETANGVKISEKTLQIDFNRATDNVRPQRNDIKPNDNSGLGSETWVYRVIPNVKAKAEKVEEKKE